MTKAIVGSFDTYEDVERAYRSLVNEGIPAADISVVAADPDSRILGPGGLPSDAPAQLHDTGAGAARGAGIGAAGGAIAGLVVGLMGLALPGIGAIAVAGPIAAALGGAGVGAVAGGILGGLTNLGVTEEEAHGYAEFVRRGGALLIVRTDSDLGPEITELMRRNNAVDITQRIVEWRRGGWQGYDPHAPAPTERQRTGTARR
jgi:hypothetical protein